MRRLARPKMKNKKQMLINYSDVYYEVLLDIYLCCISDITVHCASKWNPCGNESCENPYYSNSIYRAKNIVTETLKAVISIFIGAVYRCYCSMFLYWEAFLVCTDASFEENLKSWLKVECVVIFYVLVWKWSDLYHDFGIFFFAKSIECRLLTKDSFQWQLVSA